MALTLKKFDKDLQRELRLIALKEKMTLCELVELFLNTEVLRWTNKKK